MSRYVYVANNPVMMRDPSGRVFGVDDVLLILAGTLILGSVDNNINGGNYFSSLLKGFEITVLLYTTWYFSPSINPFGMLAKGSQGLAFGINVSILSFTSGTQSGNSFNNFAKNVMIGKSFEALAAQWLGWGADNALLPELNSPNWFTSGLIYSFAQLVIYSPAIDNYCHPQESDGSRMVDSDGRSVNRCR